MKLKVSFCSNETLDHSHKNVTMLKRHVHDEERETSSSYKYKNLAGDIWRFFSALVAGRFGVGVKEELTHSILNPRFR